MVGGQTEVFCTVRGDFVWKGEMRIAHVATSVRMYVKLNIEMF